MQIAMPAIFSINAHFTAAIHLDKILLSTRTYNIYTIFAWASIWQIESNTAHKSNDNLFCRTVDLSKYYIRNYTSLIYLCLYIGSARNSERMWSLFATALSVSWVYKCCFYFEL